MGSVAVIELSEDANGRQEEGAEDKEEAKSLLAAEEQQPTSSDTVDVEGGAGTKDSSGSGWLSHWKGLWEPGANGSPSTWACIPRSWGGWVVLVLLGVLMGVALSALTALGMHFVSSGSKDIEDIHFLVIGDWGREGGQNQTAVAQTMARKADSFRPEFIISVGDNFYESGLNSPEDPQFTTSFTDVYNQDSLQVPWYAVLGNHDYGEWWDDTKDLKVCPKGATDCYLSPLHQLNKRLWERDKRWQCERWYEMKLMQGRAEIFFIDTNPFIQEYHERPWANTTGGISEQSWEAQILELDARLAASEAEWKLVVGHHPVRNQHMPENTPELMQHLEPVLETQGVQAYFSGHEHNLQYMHVDGAATHYIVSGAGSLTDYPANYWDNGGGRFQHQGSGFVACSLRSKQLQCSFHGISDDELYVMSSRV